MSRKGTALPPVRRRRRPWGEASPILGFRHKLLNSIITPPDGNRALRDVFVRCSPEQERRRLSLGIVTARQVDGSTPNRRCGSHPGAAIVGGWMSHSSDFLVFVFGERW